jgi:Flp pilus assembly pilin Flp
MRKLKVSRGRGRYIFLHHGNSKLFGKEEVPMAGLLKRFLKEEAGPTAVEYAIMLALVALAVAIAQPNIRTAVINIFDQTAQALGGLV